MSEDWLAELFAGAGGNLDVAINHLLDTPEDRMRRVSGVRQGFSAYAGYNPATGQKVDVYGGAGGGGGNNGNNGGATTPKTKAPKGSIYRGAVSKTDPGFVEFAGAAKAIGGGDLDDNWLIKVYDGANRDLDIAINHMLDTPDNKMVRHSTASQGFGPQLGFNPNGGGAGVGAGAGAGGVRSSNVSVYRGGINRKGQEFLDFQQTAHAIGG